MKVNLIRLQNFGKHKKLELHTDAPVVGIIGPNGSGKSTALNALKFVFTGSLDDSLASYIKNGEKFAKVEIEFVKNGQLGKAMRRITSTSSSRELVWNGETSTKAAEVDAKLADILGADKHAVANAVFIPQGDLDRILFGDQAEREKLFTRLVNVAFLEKTVGIIEGKIKSESTGIEDLAPVLDELRLQLVGARNAVRGVEDELRGHPDQTPALQWLRRVRDESARNVVTRNRWDTAKQAAARARTEFDTELKNVGYSDIGDLDFVLEATQQESVTTNNACNTLKLGKQIKERIQQRQQSIDSAKHWLEDNRTRVGVAVAKLQGKDLPAMYQQLLTLESRGRLEQELAGAEHHLAKIKSAGEAHTRTKDENAESKIAEAKAIVETNTKGLAVMKQTQDILRMVLTHPHNDNTCPVCSQNIAAGVLSQHRLAELESASAEFNKQLLTARAVISITEAAVIAWNNETNRINNALELQTKRVQKLTTDLQAVPSGDAATLRAAYAEGVQAQTELAAAQRDTAKYETQLKALESQTLSESDLSAAAAFNDAALLAAGVAVGEIATKLSRLQTLKSLLNFKQQTLQRAESDAVAATTALEAGVQAFRLLQAAPPSVDLAIAVAGGQLDAKLVELEGKDRQRAECEGRLSQSRSQLKELQVKESDLEDRMHKNAARQQVVDDLRRLRDTLHRQGLPLAYVEYQFLRLTTLAQQSLSDLGSNFTIETHPERSVAFTFTRLDESDGVSMDQNKLSGGQRVRLSIAFLLAVQKLLIPEVGLLVLDEPSTHLDQDSVEALKELLMGMAQTLQNSEHQVWVVDHHEVLQTAFGSCLRLT